ncbi:Phytoene dehydrogenase [Teratosphaeria destructans]|uniref:Phytoene desaturase n=1 Tax=Teratosphaeria destructans TaxID=418781 RepID=A0A9W7W2Q1_9PEZI|nr:Phytoene dehydrogenase [Teratosphaeria destructans]
MAEKQRQPTAIVIGAGVGGVSTAARLAHAGFSVTVLEKNDFTGGRCSLIHYNAPETERSYRFDQGPSLLLLPRFFYQTFEELGTSLEKEGIELRKCEPNYRIWFHDGQQVELSSDLAVMKREIERWEGREGFERYTSWLGESGRHYELSVEHVLLQNFESLKSMLRWGFLSRVLILHPFESIWTRASKYFWSERLRRVFTFGSMYMGMSPFDAPGTYSLLQYTELAEGIWYPVGGFWRIVEGLVSIGKRMGVEYRLNTAVERVLLDEGGTRARGVALAGGEVLEADVVVNNSDLVYAYNHLLRQTPTQQSPQETSAYAESLNNRPASCSSLSFYWALSSRIPELEAHNIFLAEAYKESFDSIFKKHLIPDQPSFYVNVPSRVDPTAAPEGKDTVVVLVPVGHLIDSDDDANLSSGNGHIASVSENGTPGLKPSTRRSAQDWDAMIALARKTILATIQSRTGVDVGPLIVHEETNSPITWQTKFNLDKGAILGLSHSFFNVLSFRPSTRARRPNNALDGKLGSGVPGRVAQLIGDAVRGEQASSIQGLYMVGASAHPGTGVPICLAGGRLVAEQVLKDRRMRIPWRAGAPVGKGKVRSVDLDQLNRPVWLDGWQDWLMLAVGLSLVPWVVLMLMVLIYWR